MSADLDRLFSAVRADADAAAPNLARPELLRRVGDRRDRTRRIVATCVTVFVVAFGLGAGVALVRGSHSTPSPATSSSASPSSPSPDAAGGAGIGAASPSPSADRAPGDPCGLADLAVDPIEGDGGGGSVGYKVRVLNRSSSMCVLEGYPALVSRIGPVPTVHTTSQSPTPVPVQPGQRAQFTIVAPNGYAGFGPSDPACANPVTYRDIAAVLRNGERLPLPKLVLGIMCGGQIHIGFWGPPG